MQAQILHSKHIQLSDRPSLGKETKRKNATATASKLVFMFDADRTTRKVFYCSRLPFD